MGELRKDAVKRVIGWREWLALPDMEVARIKAKVDTGARTSSLHAFDLETFTRRGREHARFLVHPLQRSARREVEVTVPVEEWRSVRDSGGKVEERPVVCTTVELMGDAWEVELTLTRRDAMGFRMLLGRQAIRGHFLVDPGRSFLSGRPARKRAGKRRKAKKS